MIVIVAVKVGLTSTSHVFAMWDMLLQLMRATNIPRFVAFNFIPTISNYLVSCNSNLACAPLTTTHYLMFQNATNRNSYTQSDYITSNKPNFDSVQHNSLFNIRFQEMKLT